MCIKKSITSAQGKCQSKKGPLLYILIIRFILLFNASISKGAPLVEDIQQMCIQTGFKSINHIDGMIIKENFT